MADIECFSELRVFWDSILLNYYAEKGSEYGQSQIGSEFCQRGHKARRQNGLITIYIIHYIVIKTQHLNTLITPFFLHRYFSLFRCACLLCMVRRQPGRRRARGMILNGVLGDKGLLVVSRSNQVLAQSSSSAGRRLDIAPPVYARPSSLTDVQWVNVPHISTNYNCGTVFLPSLSLSVHSINIEYRRE